MLFDTVSAPKKGGERDKKAENEGQSYTVEEILHPTLHRKLPVFIGIFHIRCRKCRIFSETFFLKRDMRGTAAGAFPGVAWPRPAGIVRARTLYLLYGADIQRSYGCAKGLLSSVPYEFFLQVIPFF